MNECQPFKGYKDPEGYGRIRSEGKRRLAHRVAYCKANGCTLDSIEGVVVRHTCDNRACCNPIHLVLGTQADNMADMVERGRSNKGTRHHLAKLTEDDVAFIRSNCINGHNEFGQSALARRFDVSVVTIHKIVHGTRWSHVPEDHNES